MNAEAMNAEVSSISALGRLLIALITYTRWHKQTRFPSSYSGRNAESQHPLSRYFALGRHSPRIGRWPHVGGRALCPLG